MTSKEIELNLAHITEKLNPEEFIYDFLLAFGISKTSISRLKKGDFNLSKVEGEILYKGKIFFKTGEEGSMLYDIEELAKEERILKQNPRFIILTNYKTVVAKDLRTKASKEFPIKELSKNYAFFLPLTGAEIYRSTNDNKADRDASYELAKLYDILIEDNADLLRGQSHYLNIFLSRLLFCFFAEDTGIFKTEGMFSDSLANHTKENGSDVHIFLTDLFRRLNTNSGDFPAYVADFPYVNGGLFRDDIVCPVFSKKSRDILLNCGNLNWDEINPDIFGSMIQAVADPEERSDLGMHYTSVPNILKLIKPLFLDELYEEFEKNQDNANNLKKLISRISQIKFFDPACGSGNFLIITYKEIRNLEIKIIKRIIDLIPPGKTIPLQFTSIKLSQFYGIEIKDFAHEMALLSLWLSEHQMNKVFETELMDYGKSEPILPLKESGNIVCGNAARMDWESVCPKKEDDEIYVIGNPPYLGARLQDALQKEDIEFIFKKESGINNLDYISIWFYKGANYISKCKSKLAFVSTNSICQGEQVPILWPILFSKDVNIEFAYKSFKWTNNAKGNAGVSVVIIGLSNKNSNYKYLYENNLRKEVKYIGPYLLDGFDSIIFPSKRQISDLPNMIYGSMPNDGGFLLLNESEKQEIENSNTESKRFIKKFIGAAEFMRGYDRYCIWINDDDLEEAMKIVEIRERIEKVKEFRLKSKRTATNKLAERPFSFGEVRHLGKDSLLIPQTGSDRRTYLPIGFFGSDYVISNAARMMADVEPYIFGILSSHMHITWVKAISGRMKDDVQYSVSLSYNTFPFPKITEKDKELISQYVFAVLDERAKFPEKTMAWLYNPDTMPTALKQAHHELDLAIERIYRLRPFESDAERLEFLFKMYDEMTKRETLFVKEKKGRNKNK